MTRRFPVLAILLLGGAAFAGRIEILSPSEGAEVAVLNAANKAFLAASPEARDAMVRGAESRARLRAAGSRPERLTVAGRHVADAGERRRTRFSSSSAARRTVRSLPRRAFGEPRSTSAISKSAATTN